MHAVRTASGHPVARVAFSPCGRWFAAAQPHHGVTLYDRATGAAVRVVGNPRRPDYSSLIFLHDGERIAASGSKGIEVFETGSGAFAAGCHHRMVRNLSLAEFRGLLLGGTWCSVIDIEYRLNDPAVVGRPFWGCDQNVDCQLSPNGRWGVGIRAVGRPVALDLHSRRELHVLDHPVRNLPFFAGYQAPDVAFAIGLPRVAISAGQSITVFDIDPDAGGDVRYDVPAPKSIAAPMFTLPPPDAWPADEPWRPPVALTPDGRGLLVKRPRERVQLWDVDAGTLAAEWSWRLDGITCLAVAPDGLTAVAGARRGHLVTWDLV